MGGTSEQLELYENTYHNNPATIIAKYFQREMNFDSECET